MLKVHLSYKPNIGIGKKMGCNRITCLFIHIQEYYKHTDVKSVYRQDQMNRTNSPTNPPLQTAQPGTRFMAPLQLN